MEDVQELKRQNNILWEQNKQCRKRIFELKDMTGYKVWEENLRLVVENLELKQENARLKAGVSV